MKVLKSFSIPALKFGRKEGQEVKKGQLDPDLENKLIKSGHLLKPARKKSKK